MVIEPITKAQLLGVLGLLDAPGAAAAASLVAAAEDVEFEPRATATAELLEVYDRRLRMGALDSVAGGIEFVDSLRRLRDAEVLMVVIESAAGTASVWVTVDVGEAVGAVAFPTPVSRDSG